MSYRGILIGGQSNGMTGFTMAQKDGVKFTSSGALDPSHATTYPHLYMFTQATDTPASTAVLATQEMNFHDAHHANPFGSCVYYMTRDYFIPDNPGDNFCILPQSHGGAGFYAQWAIGKPSYEDMVTQINAFLAQDPGNTIECFLWQHGEQDVGDSGLGLGNYATMSAYDGYTKYFTDMIADLKSRVTGGFNCPILIGNMPPDIVYGPTDTTADPNYPSGIGPSADGQDHHNSGGVPIYRACKDIPNVVTNCKYVDPLNPTKIVTHAGIRNDYWGNVAKSGTSWLDSAEYWVHYSDASQQELGHRYYKALRKLRDGKTVLTAGWS